MDRKKLMDLRKTVLDYYRKAGRHDLPWRKVQSPYAVFISEVMLQQTQVHRVLPKFEAFIKVFPDFKTLGKASLPEVYALWQGLGYNRRAKFLRDAAKIITEECKEILPSDKVLLQRLPGIGPYTAGAISAFAFGNPEAFVETNLRTVVTHHVFPRSRKVRDEHILKVLVQLQPKAGSAAQEWYAALMDYGSHLKQSGVRINNKSAHYTKQKAFKGSQREVRGAVVRVLGLGKKKENELFSLLPFTQSKIRLALKALAHESLIVYVKGFWTLAA